MRLEEIVSKRILIEAICYIEECKRNPLTFREVERKIELLEKTKADALEAMEKKGYKYDCHGEKAAIYTDELCKAFGFPDVKRLVVDFAAEWHDIGKTQLPQEILNKPGKLTKEEWAIIETHPLKSEELLKPLSYPAKIARYHHRRFDGAGYPEIINGDEIPLGSRIISVAESYRIMISRSRPYKKDAPIEEIRKATDRRGYILPLDIALEELEKNARKQFDADVVEYFIKILKQGKIKS